ncbi:hypothetical protein M2322_004745 [Rhodoblastus acidophilus]|nr:hypothetical protein [Rhodoblastus acidophilus]
MINFKGVGPADPRALNGSYTLASHLIGAKKC